MAGKVAADILRSHSSEICHTLNISDISLQSLSVSLFSDGIIDNLTKINVMRTKGLDGARCLMQSVGKVIENDKTGNKLKTLLARMKELAILKDTAESIEDSGVCLSMGFVKHKYVQFQAPCTWQHIVVDDFTIHSRDSTCIDVTLWITITSRLRKKWVSAQHGWAGVWCS